MFYKNRDRLKIKICYGIYTDLITDCPSFLFFSNKSKCDRNILNIINAFYNIKGLIVHISICIMKYK